MRSTVYRQTFRLVAISLVFGLVWPASLFGALGPLYSRDAKFVSVRKTGGIAASISDIYFGFFAASNCTSLIQAAYPTGNWWALVDNQIFGPTQTGTYNAGDQVGVNLALVQSIRFTFSNFTNYNPIFSTAYAGNGASSICVENVTCSSLSHTCASADSIPVQDFTMDE